MARAHSGEKRAGHAECERQELAPSLRLAFHPASLADGVTPEEATNVHSDLNASMPIIFLSATC